MTMRTVQIVALVSMGFCAGIAPAASLEYRVTFNATWSQATHPQDFPANPHFSSLVGAAHNANVTFWAEGELATTGIKDIAERGSSTVFRAEVDAAVAAGNASGRVLAGNINPSPGVATGTFIVDSDFPLVTFVSMIAPSPDWFVGVTGLRLHDNGTWFNNVVVDLAPYDAGTDSGTTFTSSNLATVPPEVISEITGFPFEGSPPLGTLAFEIVPEPTTMALLALGIMHLLRRRGQ